MWFLLLNQPFDRTDWIRTEVEDTWRTNRDPHVFFGQVGEAIGFVPEATVIGAFTTTWAEEMAEESKAVAQLIHESLTYGDDAS